MPISGVLHLKTALAALPDGSLFAHAAFRADSELFPQLHFTPEPSGAQLVVLDERKLLLSNDCPHSVELYEQRGYETVTVDISEFQKLEGAVTCLSVLADQALR